MVTLAKEKGNAKFLKILERYQKTPGALIPVLQGVQETYGYLPQEVLVACSRNLKVPLSEILGVATFYAQFSLQPQAQNMIRVCHGTACHVAGAEVISGSFETELGIKEKEATQDKKFSLDRVNCLGCCSLAPVAMINQDTHGRLTLKKIKEVIGKYE